MKRRFLLLATLILLVAAFLRLYDLAIYPPGPHYDEAVYLLITRSIAFGGARPFPIVEAYQGREVLYMYLNAPLLHLWGDNIFTLQASNALLSILTVAATTALGRAMFRGRRGIIIGLVMGVCITISYPNLWLERQAFRANTLPFMQAMALWLLFRGLRARKHGAVWLAFAGLFAGGALYTYMASRLFPVWLALGALILLIADRRHWRTRLGQGVIFFGVLVIVALPMALYAIQQPDIFLGRLGEVSGDETSITLGESIRLHLLMFFIEGDPYLRYNVPGRPYLTLPEGILLLVGFAVALWRLFRANTDGVARAGYALALLSPLMVLPSVVSVDGLPPSHMRSLGMIPLIFVLVAVGAEALIAGIPSRWQPRIVTTAIIAALAVGSVNAGVSYWTWAGRADVFYETDADLAAAASWLNQQQATGGLGENTIVYAAAKDRPHPTLQELTDIPVRWLGTDTLILPPPGTPAMYVFPRSAPPDPLWRDWLEPYRITDLPIAPDGRTAFEAFQLPMNAPEPSFMRDGGTQNAVLTLRGISTTPTQAGEDAPMLLLWRVLHTPAVSDLQPIIQLNENVGADTFVLDRVQPFLTQANTWQPGETVILRLNLHVPLGTPPVLRYLNVAWVERSTETYLPYTSGQGREPLGIWANVGELQVLRPAQPLDPAALTMDVRQSSVFAPGVELMGWNRLPESIRPGEALSIRGFWRAVSLDEQRGVYDTPLRLLYEDGNSEYVSSGMNLLGNFLPSAWQEGDGWMATGVYPLPPTLPPGQVRVQLITPASDLIEFGELTIADQPRLFERPASDTPLDVVFADQIRLGGYSLGVQDDQLNLRLVWQAVTQMSRRYKVFVHVLDVAGNILVQQDVEPQGNTYPTTLWLHNEFVVDEYLVALPQDATAVHIGLYPLEGGTRLPITFPLEQIGDDAIELTLFPS